MFQSNIDEMREAVIRLSLRTPKPETVLILKEHAKYLGVRWRVSSGKPKPPRPELPQGQKIEMVVVQLADLYRAFQKDPKGIDVIDPLVSRKKTDGPKTPTWRQGN